jgi:hypothetical protein
MYVNRREFIKKSMAGICSCGFFEKIPSVPNLYFGQFRPVGCKTDFEIRGGDPRFYVSVSPFHHLTDDGSLNYIDGLFNPSTRMFKDQFNLYGVLQVIKDNIVNAIDLNDDYLLFGYEEICEEFFLSGEYGMKPDFAYSKIIDGYRNENNPFGLLDSRKLWYLAGGVILLNARGSALGFNCKVIDWLDEFYEINFSKGFEYYIFQKHNNHAAYYLALRLIVAYLTGRSNDYSMCYEWSRSEAVLQISEDSLPLNEINRNNAVGHIMMNANAWCCVVASLCLGNSWINIKRDFEPVFKMFRHLSTRDFANIYPGSMNQKSLSFVKTLSVSSHKNDVAFYDLYKGSYLS